MRSKKRNIGKLIAFIVICAIIIAALAVSLILILSKKDKDNSSSDASIPEEIKQYTLTFTVNGTVYQSETHAAGDEISLPADPVIEGYDFISWDTVLPSVMPESDLTLSAVLKAKIFTLTYLLDGEAVSVSEVEYGSVLTSVSPEYDKESHLFSGWTNLPDKMPARDLEVIGHLYSIEDAIVLDLSILEDGGRFDVTEGGIYIVKGKTENGQIVISVPDQNITLLMMSAEMTYLGESAPIYCVKGETLTITLLPDSQSSVSDSEANLLDGAIHVKSADLTINGSGSLTVNSSHEGIYNSKNALIEGGKISIDSLSHGICVKDSLTISGGRITVNALGDAIKVKGDTDSDGLYVERSGELIISGGLLDLKCAGDGIDVIYKYTHSGGDLTINAESDGIKSDHSIYIGSGSLTVNSTEDGIKSSIGASAGASGNIIFAGGKVSVNSDLDSVQAQGDIMVAQLAAVDLVAGGGPDGEAKKSEDGSELSQKGLKADGNVTISGGVITIKSLECSIKSAKTISISAGVIEACAGADVIKNDDSSGTIVISGGTLELEALGDAIAARESLSISGGSISAVTTGKVAVSGGGEGGFGGMQRPGSASSSSSSSSYPSSKGLKSDGVLEISGGNISAESTGHSIHSGGKTDISGGNLYIASSSGKGIAAHGDVNISGTAYIFISEATEAVESKMSITVAGGTVCLISSDDGFNTGGSVSASNYSSHRITVSGGFIYAVGGGDVFDSNGDTLISGGTTLVFGPSNGGNSCLDSQYGIMYTGGTFIGVASSSSMWKEDIIGNITGDYVYNTSCGSLSQEGVIAFTDKSGDVICALTSPLYGNIGVLFMSDLTENIEDCSLIINASYEGDLGSFGFAFGGKISGGSTATLYSGADAAGGGDFPGGGGFPGGPGGGGNPGGRPR